MVAATACRSNMTLWGEKSSGVLDFTTATDPPCRSTITESGLFTPEFLPQIINIQQPNQY